MKIVLEHREKSVIEYKILARLRKLFIDQGLYTHLQWGDTDSTDMQLWVILIPHNLTLTCDLLGTLDATLTEFFGDAITSPVHARTASSTAGDGATRFMVEFKREFEPVLYFLGKIES
jgi:hypothetical protein